MGIFDLFKKKAKDSLQKTEKPIFEEKPKLETIEARIQTLYGQMLQLGSTPGGNPFELMPKMEKLLEQLVERGDQSVRDFIITIRDGHHGMLELTALCCKLLFQMEGAVNEDEVISACNQPEVLRQLLDRGANVNARDSWWRQTVLIWACQKGNIEAVRILLERGAKIDLKTDYGDTACSVSLAEGHTKILELLLNAGADPNTKIPPQRYDIPLLHEVSKEGVTEVVKLLLDKGVDPNVKNASGDTALMNACATGKIEVVKLLLEREADVNARTISGKTALDWVIGGDEKIRDEIRRVLEKKGSSPYRAM